MKKRKIVISENELRSLLREHIIKSNYGILNEGLDDAAKAARKIYRQTMKILDDPSAIKGFETFYNSEKKFGWLRAAQISARKFLTITQWIFTPISKGLRTWLAKKPGAIKEGIELFGNNFNVIDDIADGSKFWEDIIPAGTRRSAWESSRLINNVEDTTLKLVNRADGSINDIPGGWPHMMIDNNRLPMPANFVNDGFDLVRTGARYPGDPTDIGQVFKVKSGAGNKVNIDDWKEANNLAGDVGDLIKVKDKPVSEWRRMMPPDKRAVIIALYYGQLVPLELAAYAAMTRLPTGAFLLDEILDLISPASNVEQMFSDKIYKDIKDVGRKLKVTELINRISIGGGTFYMGGQSGSEDMHKDYDQFRLLLASYYLMLDVASDEGMHRYFENVRQVFNAFQGLDFRGDDKDLTAAELEAFKEIARPGSARISIGDGPAKMRAAWAGIASIKEDLSLADFSQCFAIAAKEDRASYGTKHFFREYFGEDVDNIPPYSRMLGPAADFGLLGLLGAGAVGLVQNLAGVNADDYENDEQFNKAAEAALAELDANIQKNVKVAIDAIEDVESVEDMIAAIYDTIRKFPGSYVWDMTGEVPVRKDKSFSANELEKLASPDKLITPKELGEFFGVGFAEVIAGDISDLGGGAAGAVAGSPTAQQELSPAEFDDKVAALSGMRSDISEAIDTIKNNSGQKGAVVAISFGTPRDSNWSQRLAYTEYDDRANDDYVGPTAYDMFSGEFAVPSTSEAENIYIERNKELISTFAKLSIVFDKPAGGIASRMAEAREYANSEYKKRAAKIRSGSEDTSTKQSLLAAARQKALEDLKNGYKRLAKDIISTKIR